ncbi:MAG TPA: hypothetical protein VKM72_33940 [Thermoanaerobaculia bacterium]|nr:hypothetical protein [Thermoanaerobaculia bacterium]
MYDEYRQAVCRTTGCPPRPDLQTQIRVLKEYCDHSGTGITNCSKVKDWSTPPTLSFDHLRQDWTADDTIDERTVEDVNGIPTVDLAHGQTVIVVVTNTNPLLYTATPGKITLQPIEQFSDLQKLAGLVGGNLAAIEAARASRGTIEAQGSSSFKDAAKALLDAADDYITGQRLADCAIGKVQLATNFVQAVELGRQDSYPRDPPQCAGGQTLTGEAVRELTAKLLRAREILALRCPDLPEAARLLLTADPNKEAEVRERLAAYEATTLLSTCANWKTDPDVMGEIDQRIIARIKKALASRGSLPVLYEDFKRSNLPEAMQNLASAAKGVKPAEEPLAKLVNQWPAIGKAAENLDAFRGRLLQNVTRNLVTCPAPLQQDLCVPHTAVATFIVVPGGPSQVTRWEFVHSRPIKIAAESPYAADVVARRSTVDTSYNLRSNLASIFDLGVSVTRTDLQAPTFGVVKRRTATDPTETKRVTVVDQESQSGKLALMLNVMPLRLWDVPKGLQGLGIQIGAATDSTKPALFWGLSYSFGKYVRVGWGGTSQRITKLRDETPLDLPLESKDDIRTRKSYKDDHYWSLTVSIRALRLFTSP